MSDDAFYVLKLLSSKLRASLLMNLIEKPKKLGEIRDELGSSSSTILHALEELESSDLVMKKQKGFELTSTGIIFALNLKNIFGISETIENQKDFWTQHDISGIPHGFLKRLGDLKNAFLIKSETDDLGKVHQTFLKVISESKELKGISPIFHPDFVSVVKDLIDKGVDVELIVTEQVFQNTRLSVGLDALMPPIKNGRLRVFLKDKLKIAMTITDRVLSLGLFTLGGAYDYSMDLVAEASEAIEWGKELFNHYLIEAKNVSEIIGG